jgi:sulfane dehydrogenase subunit SoxC
VSDKKRNSGQERRLAPALSSGGACGRGGAGGAAAARAAGDPLITEIQDWNRYLGDGVDAAPYGIAVGIRSACRAPRRPWLTADPVSSVNFTPLHELDGIITPNGLCFERHHGGTAIIDPAEHRLMINGLVDTPLVFTMQDLMRFPRENRVYFLECAANSGMEWRGSQLNGCQFTHGMVHCVVYTGVPLRYLLEEAGVKTNGKWVLAEGADASAMTRSIPIEKALDDCLVAFKMNGEALRPEQGYPVRLVVPGWEGNMWVKWLRRLEVGDEPWAQREETSKYTDLLETGRRAGTPGQMEVKSVITNPSPQAPITHGRGPTVISGLAWSGNGRHQACRCFARRRPQLAGGARRRTEPAEGAASLLPTTSTGTDRNCCSSRGRSTRPATSSRPRTSCAPRVAELDLSQQRYPDLVCQSRRSG